MKKELIVTDADLQECYPYSERFGHEEPMEYSLSESLLNSQGWYKVDDSNMIVQVQLSKSDADFIEATKHLPLYNVFIDKAVAYIDSSYDFLNDEDMRQNIMQDLLNARINGYTLKPENYYNFVERNE